MGYSLFYPLMVAALALMPVRQQSRRASVANMLDVLATVGGALMLVWFVLLGAALQDGVMSMESALNVSYRSGTRCSSSPAAESFSTAAIQGRLPPPDESLPVPCASLLVTSAVGWISRAGAFSRGGSLDLFLIAALLCFALAATCRHLPSARQIGLALAVGETRAPAAHSCDRC